jgi:hypothetical protein
VSTNKENMVIDKEHGEGFVGESQKTPLESEPQEWK